MRTKTKCQLIDEAYNWHGGKSSPLYSFASTMTVHSEDHRLGLAKEIAKNIDWIANTQVKTRAVIAKLGGYTEAGKRKEIATLSKLAGMIAEAKIGEQIVTDAQMTAFWRG
jgi:hypothetical protein